MERWLIAKTVDLSQDSLDAVDTNKYYELMVPGDQNAHTIRLTFVRDGTPISMTGKTAYAYFMRSNGTDAVRITGSISNNVISFTMSSECYAYPGFMTCIVKISDSSDEISAAMLRFFVQDNIPGQIVNPGTPTPTPGGAVNSVNGKTGTVVLSASDVGALPSNTTLANLTQDSTHRTVTDAEKAAWNAAAYGTFDFSRYEENDVGGALCGMPIFHLSGDTTGMSKTNAKTMSFTFRNSTGTCSVKWQGNSSLYFPKKNYTIGSMSVAVDFGWGDVQKIVLKADYVDVSHVRNVCCAKLWSQIVDSRNTEYLGRVTNAWNLITWAPRNGAIDGFPVMLEINGEYQGVYNLTIPKDVNLFCGEDHTDMIISAENYTDNEATGFWHTTTAANIQNEVDFGAEYISDDSYTRAANSLNAMINAVLADYDNYAAFVQYVEPKIDISSAIDYAIFSILTANIDGIYKNYLLYSNDGTKWIFSAYDLDGTLGNHYYGFEYFPPETAAPTVANFQTYNRLWFQIWNHAKDRFAARYWELRRTVLSVGNITDIIYNYAAKIAKIPLDEDMKYWYTQPGTNTNSASQIIDWFRARCEYMDQQVRDLFPIPAENLYEGTKEFSGVAWNEDLAYWQDLGERYEGFKVLQRASIYGGISKSVTLTANKTYTLSAYIWAEEGSEIVFTGTNVSEAGTSVNRQLDLGGAWRRVKMTFNVTSASAAQYPRFENRVNGKIMKIAGLSLAENDYMTEWTDYAG